MYHRYPRRVKKLTMAKMQMALIAPRTRMMHQDASGCIRETGAAQWSAPERHGAHFRSLGSFAAQLLAISEVELRRPPRNRKFSEISGNAAPSARFQLVKDPRRRATIAPRRRR